MRLGEVFSKLMAGEIAPVEYYDNVVITSSGEQKIIAFHNTIIRNKGSRITGILFSGEDITERKHAEDALRIERDNLKNIFETMEDGVYNVNQHYDVQYVNSVLKKDFGAYEGRKCYEYFHDLTEVCPWCKNPDVFAGKTVQWEWYSSKNQRTYDLVDTPLKNPDGSISKLEIFRDITERKQAEEQLKASLKEKEVLLLEIHHRVKNNLQVVSSLLNLQARAAKDETTSAVLLESRDRINTMALIHTDLYESGNLSEINMKGFVEGLIRQLFMGYRVRDTKITPVVHVADCTLPISIAVPFGLVVNELLTNAFKHAFVNRAEGKIEVSLSASEKGAVCLIVSDDGVGLPEGFDFNTTKTLGLHLVKILVEDQLLGKLEVVSDKGATFKVEFQIEDNGAS
ncbi:Two-component sensor histidine kinase [Candidatus Methanophagaceae archaeon]|nr:Two-component sensor histidine kinase [Methanophagales archaeon]